MIKGLIVELLATCSHKYEPLFQFGDLSPELLPNLDGWFFTNKNVSKANSREVNDNVPPSDSDRNNTHGT